MTEENVHTWSVELLIGEREGHTHAEARLHTNDATHLPATGRARLRPSDHILGRRGWWRRESMFSMRHSSPQAMSPPPEVASRRNISPPG